MTLTHLGHLQAIGQDAQAALGKYHAPVEHHHALGQVDRAALVGFDGQGLLAIGFFSQSGAGQHQPDEQASQGKTGTAWCSAGRAQLAG